LTTTREQEQQEEGEYLDPYSIFKYAIHLSIQKNTILRLSSGAFSLSPGGGTKSLRGHEDLDPHGCMETRNPNSVCLFGNQINIAD